MCMCPQSNGPSSITMGDWGYVTQKRLASLYPRLITLRVFLGLIMVKFIGTMSFLYGLAKLKNLEKYCMLHAKCQQIIHFLFMKRELLQL